MLVGAVVGLAVWLSLPLALHRDSCQTNGEVTHAVLSVAAIPYLATGAGLCYLYVTDRARGRENLRAAGMTLASAAIAYFAGAALILSFGLVSFAR